MADELSFGKTRSEEMVFDVPPLEVVGVAVGKIKAIRVQDIEKQKWFNYDNGAWDTPPVITVGLNKLYIAFWIVNEGDSGDITLNVKDAQGLLATKTLFVSAGDGLGVEFTGDMPNKYYDVTLESQPNDSLLFTITPIGAPVPPPPTPPTGIPSWQIALIAASVIIGAGGALYIAYGEKWKRRAVELE